MLVASELATPGSVMQKAERISPSSSGRSHCSFCASVPIRWSSSMLPVSGAWQFIASGASSLLQPLSSASGAYSSWVRPDSEGRKRFHSPRSRAFALSSSMTGGTVWSSGPTCSRYSSYVASAGNTSERMNSTSSSCSSTALSEGVGNAGYMPDPRVAIRCP